MRFLIRRLRNGLFLLLGVSLLSFALMQAAPGDFFQDLRLDAQISPATVTALRTRYGLDRPFLIRYLLWLKSALSGDFGYSLAYNSPVTGLLQPRIFNTLALNLTATLAAWLLALPIGIWSAAWQGNWRDRVCAGSTSTLLAIPDLVLALGLLLLAVKSGVFPTGGMKSVGFSGLSHIGKLRDLLSHFFLPCATLTLAMAPMIVRHVRASMIEALHSPFVLAAVANGVPSRRILWGHAMRGAANPLVSLFGITVGTLLSSSLLIEVIMSWPGLGPLVVEAILARDVQLVVGVVVMSTTLLIGGNLAADLLLYAVDPRIRRT